MRCHICDNILDVVVIDTRTGKIAPCHECQDVIDETVFEWEEEPDFYPDVFDEDEDLEQEW